MEYTAAELHLFFGPISKYNYNLLFIFSRELLKTYPSSCLEICVFLLFSYFKGEITQ